MAQNAQLRGHYPYVVAVVGAFLTGLASDVGRWSLEGKG